MTQPAVLAPPARRPPRGASRRAGRMAGSGRPGWSLLVLAVAFVVASPVVAVVVDGLLGSEEIAMPRGLGSMVLTTLLLMLGVGVGTLVIGGGLAWLVTAYRFPLRNALV